MNGVYYISLKREQIYHVFTHQHINPVSLKFTFTTYYQW